MTGHRADLTLFRAGEDEGSVEAMFSPGVPLSTKSRFDGLLVVRIKVHFVFASSIPRRLQWDAMNVKFHRYFYGSDFQELLRFQLVGGTRLKRIAVIFDPAYAYGAAGSADGAHFVLKVTSATAVDPNKSPFIQDRPPRDLELGVVDVDPFPIVCMSLGWAGWTPAPNGKGRVPATGPITAATLSLLASRVDALLGEPAGSRSPQPV